ncbi:ATP-binding cassette domain-containing protein [Entomospira culicis]|uniref:ABC transporter ATP-binding protein n=1 Tax=Entomospira culicis TaxID=2719989 RepID=A0A968GIW2_9SPIO|nr:ABC transporter ATP-binding protein [Entomospira culicis]NIZ19316.1 ABC transporter ATP-binding protein [Entomospira culicis]NIZ69779.1 ABC transporter ATP-binding protein [Entomospira culicis]WDI36890.1 ABC transporter ATP-binding protein [Entomospira culicis]WDI38519.1 ABC transporter ATP-binding protein [Entomospira culicis]
MLTIKQLSYRYPKGKKTLYKNLDITFSPGEIYGLMGQNGEGKTTLLKLVAGLIEPRDGQITWCGEPIGGRHFLKDLFFLPEETDLPPLSLQKYMKLLAPLYPKFSISLFEEIAQKFNLETNKVMHKMSFGQKKKSLIALGLATQCSLMILDEPTNGLDVQSKAVLRDLLMQMQNPNRTIIISTHQARDLQEIISGLTILHENRVVFNHTLSFMQQHLAISTETTQESFHQSQLGGIQQSLIANTSGQKSHLDLEFIFLAATNGSQNIQRYLAQQASQTPSIGV